MSNLSPSRPLIAFTLLKQCSELMHTDLLGGVALLIRPVVANLSGRVYDSRILAERLASAYGLDLPGDALEDFTQRLLDSGILISEELQGGMKRAVYAQQPQTSVEDSSEEFQQILDEFVSHARKLLNRAGQEFEEQELHSAFLRHLATLDFSAIRAKPVVRTDADTKLLGPSTKDQISLSENLQRDASLDAIVASYVIGLQVTGGDRLALLAKVADGALAAELVLDLRAPHSVPRLTNTTVVIDTPLILSLLDLSSSQDKEDAKRLLSSVTEAGAKIAAFHHSIEEAEGVLVATNNARGFGEAYGPAIARLSNSRYRAYYESMTGKIASTWQQKHHFEIVQETATHFYKNFSGDDEEALTAHLRFSLADRLLTRERDAKSVAETIRRLGGIRISINNIASCRMIFVTPNGTLARRTSSFLREKKFLQKGDFSPIVTNRYLAGLCWLISGGESTQSPTTARLLSNCAAALQLRPEISLRTKRFLKDIDPEMAEHFEALMTNERAAQYLAEVTFNDPNLVTANNVEDIYTEVQRRAAEKVGSEKDAFYADKLTALEKEKSAAKEAENDLRSTLEALKLDAKNAQVRAEKLAEDATTISTEYSEQKSTLDFQQSKIELLENTVQQLSSTASESTLQLSQYRATARVAAGTRAQRWARIIRVFLAILLFALTLAIGYLDKFILPALPPAYQAFGNGALIATQALLSIVGLSTFTNWANKPFVALQNSIYRNRLESLGIPDHD